MFDAIKNTMRMCISEEKQIMQRNEVSKWRNSRIMWFNCKYARKCARWLL